jgi:MFS superfamily sulfate permease-like transporter
MISVLRLDGGLFFATADALEERIRALASDQGEQLHALVPDLEGVSLGPAISTATSTVPSKRSSPRTGLPRHPSAYLARAADESG